MLEFGGKGKFLFINYKRAKLASPTLSTLRLAICFD